ncbi:MAG: hypothetical protein QOG53_762 [Frankiales bacterium]|nr:hypothetical protein [Frankiales bacterium]
MATQRRADAPDLAVDLQVVHRPDPLPSQRPSPEFLPPDRRDSAANAELRDRLTRAHLRAAAEGAEVGDLVRFRRGWWDGAVRVPSLVVRLGPGRGRQRCRLVETHDGQIIALPASSWRARRALRRLRRPAAVDPALLLLATKGAADTRLDGRPGVVVVPRPHDDRPHGQPTSPPSPRRTTARVLLIEQLGDAVRCGHAACAGLVPIPPPGRISGRPTACSRCGRT